MADTVQKARICELLNDSPTGKEVVCKFNPTDYTIKKTNKWTVKPKKGRDVGKSDFGGGTPATLKMKLFFDTTDTGEDVRQQTSKLWDMMMVNQQNINPKTQKGEPPQVMFQWGRGKFFKAVIKTLSQKFTMFTVDGTPIRAELDVTVQQYKDDKIYEPQNPTSRGEARKVWVVQAGQTLDWIAYQEYGDSAQWRYIAEVNNLANPTRLQNGQILKLMPLP